VRLHLRFGLLPDRVLGSYCASLQVCMEGAVDTLAVPSDEHTPLSEIVVNFKSQRSLVRLAE
jgi:hypothetical protein